MDALRDPIRKIPLPFAGDLWAQPDAQVAPDPATDGPLICTGGALRWRGVPYDGVGQTSQPVDGDASTIDYVIAKVRTDREGNVTIAHTITTVESEGGQVNVGKQQTEDDVSLAEQVYIGVVTVTQDMADALWIFVDAGARTYP